MEINEDIGLRNKGKEGQSWRKKKDIYHFGVRIFLCGCALKAAATHLSEWKAGESPRPCCFQSIWFVSHGLAPFFYSFTRPSGLSLSHCRVKQYFHLTSTENRPPAPSPHLRHAYLSKEKEKKSNGVITDMHKLIIPCVITSPTGLSLLFTLYMIQGYVFFFVVPFVKKRKSLIKAYAGVHNCDLT